MNGGVEQTHRLAEVTVGALKKVGLPATPNNYALWYAHLEGKNPSLSRDIQIATDAFGKMTQDNADALFRAHMQQAEYAQSVSNLVLQFNAEVSDLHDMLEESGASVTGNTETLSEISDQLRQSAEDYPAVGALLESVFTVAKDMRAQNQQLETRLADSANEISHLQKSVEAIEEASMKDPLTGCANRARFDKTIHQCIAESTATGDPLSLLLSDIDHFKSFNDTHGHQTGDQVLRLVAEVMQANIRGGDTLARYGGEEFAILLPGAELENARALAERIRQAVEARRLKKRRTNEDLGAITMSIGVAEYHGRDSVDTLIERADECLYAAKDRGRNCVIDQTERRQNPDGFESRKSGAA